MNHHIAYRIFALTVLAGFSLATSLCAGTPTKEVAAPVPTEEEEEPLFSGSLGVAWDSKYVTEGRNNLDEGGLVSTALELSALGFTAGAWYGDSYDTDYAELNLGLEYGFEIGPVAAYVGYTYLHFEEDGNDDHEFNAGLDVPLFFLMTGGVDYVYCDSADGSFLEFSLDWYFPLKGGFEMPEGGKHAPVWVLLPSVILGIDMGYATEDHDGANHVQLQLATEYTLTENLTLGAYIAQTIALEDVNQDGGEDLFFGGVSVTVSF